MLHAILDREYQLKNCLKSTPISAVFLATNTKGEPHVVHFYWETELFFEQLARSYACDASEHLCRLVYNYPPYQISGQTTFFQKDLLQCLSMEDFIPALAQQHPSIWDSKVGHIGALVFQYVSGPPLLQVLRVSQDRDKLDYLRGLARALDELHENGEFHGDLIPDNVVLCRKTQTVKLLDPGFYPGKRHFHREDSPEHQSRKNLSLGSHTDVFMFARIYLSCLDRPTVAQQKCISACLHPQPSKRPTMAKVMKHLYSRNHARWLGDTFRAPVRRVSLAAVCLVLMGFLTFIVRNHSGSESSLSPAPGSQMALTNGSPTLDLTTNGPRFWEEPTWASGTHTSNMTMESRSWLDAPATMVKEIIPEEWERPIALFTTGEESFLASTKGLLRNGERVIYKGELGRIGHITPAQLVIEGAQTTRHIRLQPPGFKLTQTKNSVAMTIWNRPQNLEELLHALKWFLEAKGVPEENRQLHGLLGFLPQPISISGQLWGQFANDSVDQLLTGLTAHFHMEQDLNFLKVTIAPSRLPTHQTCGRLLIDQSTVKGFGTYLSNQIGCTVVAPKFLEEKPLPRKQFGDVPWEDVLQGLGISWYLETVDGKPVIVIQGLTN